MSAKLPCFMCLQNLDGYTTERAFALITREMADHDDAAVEASKHLVRRAKRTS